MCNLSDIRAEAKRARYHHGIIRVEKKGRELHHKRFSSKGNINPQATSVTNPIYVVDDGHKIRLKVLEKQMKVSLMVLDSLDAKE
jgi:hypothetical protein